MKPILFLLTFLFPYTHSLICLTKCRNWKVKKGESFQKTSPTDGNKCQYDHQAKRCYGRITAYYNGIKVPDYISYSLGRQEHIIEKEIEELANKNHLKSIIYFLFLTESFEYDQLIITVYILCQTSDDCALNYIKEFFHFYQKQKNPITEFDFLLKDDNTLSQLHCYDSESKGTKECFIHSYTKCLFHHTNVFQQGCYSDPMIKLEYAFMVTSAKTTSLEKVEQLIICNRDNCNDQSLINQMEIVIYNSTFGTILSINHSNRIQFRIILLIILQILFDDI